VYHRHQREEKVAMLESKMFRVWFGATLLLCFISCGTFGAQKKQQSIAPYPDTYRIGPGDVIQVDVYQHPELSKGVVVRRDGNITLPSAGPVKVSGLSAMEVAVLVRDKLEAKISKPQVTVNIIIHSGPPIPPSPEPLPRDIPSPEPQHQSASDRPSA
jgi:protein involved in polysaccharide export with SLBB domain